MTPTLGSPGGEAEEPVGLAMPAEGFLRADDGQRVTGRQPTEGRAMRPVTQSCPRLSVCAATVPRMTDTSGDDRRLPPALAELARTPIDYADGEGIDFEPYETFCSTGETTDWLRQWTGNPELDGDAFRVFGQDGTGGLAALWRIRPGRPLTEQPVVFLGSEGETGVVAGSLPDFLWVLAEGIGPLESVLHDDHSPRPEGALPGLAARHATTPRRPARTIIAEARAEFPDFTASVDALCR